MRHFNKYWLREKEYRLIKKLESDIYHSGYRLNKSSWESEIGHLLDSKFWTEESGRYNSAPKWFRKVRNRKERYKSKITLYRELSGKDVTYSDNYRGCNWSYW